MRKRWRNLRIFHCSGQCEVQPGIWNYQAFMFIIEYGFQFYLIETTFTKFHVRLIGNAVFTASADIATPVEVKLMEVVHSRWQATSTQIR